MSRKKIIIQVEDSEEDQVSGLLLLSSNESRFQNKMTDCLAPTMCQNLLTLILFVEKYDVYANLGGDVLYWIAFTMW